MDAVFPGLKGMLNYHPLFVHFPIALWTAALLFEIAARLACANLYGHRRVTEEKHERDHRQ